MFVFPDQSTVVIGYMEWITRKKELVLTEVVRVKEEGISTRRSCESWFCLLVHLAVTTYRTVTLAVLYYSTPKTCPKKRVEGYQLSATNPV